MGAGQRDDPGGIATIPRSPDHREGTPMIMDVVSVAQRPELVECLRHEDDGCPPATNWILASSASEQALPPGFFLSIFRLALRRGI